MPTKTPTFQKMIALPAEVYAYYRRKAKAEFQSLSSLFRAVIMRDYNARIAGTKKELPEMEEPEGGVNHQLTYPLAVHNYYQGIAKREGLDLMPILRGIIIEDYMSSMGLPADADGDVGTVPVANEPKARAGVGTMRGLITASEEPPLLKKKRKRAKKE